MFENYRTLDSLKNSPDSLKNKIFEIKKDDISGFIYCKDCISDQNRNGELFVFTKTSGLRLTEINIENIQNLNFLQLDKPNMEKARFPENVRRTVRRHHVNGRTKFKRNR